MTPTGEHIFRSKKDMFFFHQAVIIAAKLSKFKFSPSRNSSFFGSNLGHWTTEPFNLTHVDTDATGMIMSRTSESTDSASFPLFPQSDCHKWWVYPQFCWGKVMVLSLLSLFKVPWIATLFEVPAADSQHSNANVVKGPASKLTGFSWKIVVKTRKNWWTVQSSYMRLHPETLTGAIVFT